MLLVPSEETAATTEVPWEAAISLLVHIQRRTGTDLLIGVQRTFGQCPGADG